MNPSFLDNLAKSGWNHIGASMIFSAGFLLLFVDKVPSKLRDYLLPALVVFGIGFVFLGYIESSVFRKNFDQAGSEKKLHPYKRLFVANAVLLLLFFLYLWFRGVL